MESQRVYVHNTLVLVLACGTSWLLQRRGRVQYFESSGPGSISGRGDL